MTVVTFTGVDTTGTNGAGAVGATGTGNAASGAPTASLVTTRNNSWVFGVGNDWDGPYCTNCRARIRPWCTNSGYPYLDTFWVQRQNATTPLSRDDRDHQRHGTDESPLQPHTSGSIATPVEPANLFPVMVAREPGR